MPRDISSYYGSTLTSRRYVRGQALCSALTENCQVQGYAPQSHGNTKYTQLTVEKIVSSDNQMCISSAPIDVYKTPPIHVHGDAFYK